LNDKAKDLASLASIDIGERNKTVEEDIFVADETATKLGGTATLAD
jgi:hypothetical protein